MERTPIPRIPAFPAYEGGMVPVGEAASGRVGVV